MKSILYGVLCIIQCTFFTGVNGHRVARIIDGDEADIRYYPYQISMRSKKNGHFCGGSIVSDRHIVTAAHCVVNINTPEVLPYIYIASGTSRSDIGGESHSISNITVHREYTGTTDDFNDIAVVTLSEPIAFSDEQRPIALPTKNVENGAAATITGWGDTTFPAGETPIYLQKAAMVLLDSDNCKGRIPYPLKNTQVCAIASLETHPDVEHVNGIRGACKGDSGGPLVANGQLVGVASYTVTCGKGHPDIYTNVYYFVDFIKNIIHPR